MRTTPITYLAVILCFILFSFVMIVDAPLFQSLHREDGPVEYFGFLFLFLTSVTLLRTFYQQREKTRMSTIALLLLFGAGVVFLFAAGEEISWGQRILGFKTPESLEQINDQNEFNLHNIQKGVIDQSVRYGLVLFSIIGTGYWAMGKKRLFGIHLPDIFTIQSIALCGIYQHNAFLDKAYYMSAGILMILLICSLTQRSRQNILLSLLSISAALAVTLVNGSYQEHMNTNSTPEIRELLFAFICLGYALDIKKVAQQANPETVYLHALQQHSNTEVPHNSQQL